MGRIDKLKAGRTEFVLLEIDGTDKLPSEDELGMMITNTLKRYELNAYCKNVIMVRDQVMTLNIDLADTCRAVVEEHDSEDKKVKGRRP